MFEFFCESISTSVEKRICVSIGNTISFIQVESLIRNGYLLGGLTVGGPFLLDPICQVVCGLFPSRILDRRLIRDARMLSNYYALYKPEYDACDDYSDAMELFNKIEQDLFDYSMSIIRNTCQFGG